MIIQLDISSVPLVASSSLFVSLGKHLAPPHVYRHILVIVASTPPISKHIGNEIPHPDSIHHHHSLRLATTLQCQKVFNVPHMFPCWVQIMHAKFNTDVKFLCNPLIKATLSLCCTMYECETLFYLTNVDTWTWLEYLFISVLADAMALFWCLDILSYWFSTRYD